MGVRWSVCCGGRWLGSGDQIGQIYGGRGVFLILPASVDPGETEDLHGEHPTSAAMAAIARASKISVRLIVAIMNFPQTASVSPVGDKPQRYAKGPLKTRAGA